MNKYDIVGSLIRDYVDERNNAKVNSDNGFDELYYIQRELRKITRDINAMVKAVDTLESYGLKVS